MKIEITRPITILGQSLPQGAVIDVREPVANNAIASKCATLADKSAKPTQKIDEFPYGQTPAEDKAATAAN